MPYFLHSRDSSLTQRNSDRISSKATLEMPNSLSCSNTEVAPKASCYLCSGEISRCLGSKAWPTRSWGRWATWLAPASDDVSSQHRPIYVSRRSEPVSWGWRGSWAAVSPESHQRRQDRSGRSPAEVNPSRQVRPVPAAQELEAEHKINVWPPNIFIFKRDAQRFVLGSGLIFKAD